ncbi:hypothetical protein AX15_007051 [Amanita polypyramis BW_CC]|nr:hypothetical protein AX15_007051 [Amanita polypyramis BW_CC]
MHLFILFVALSAALLARAEIYVTEPASGSTCHGGKSCTVQWLDDGNTPLLSSVGLCTVGLYTNHLQLVQALAYVNVSETHSFTFTPIPSAGPNSDAYYISFAPVSDMSYRGFSAWFALDDMTGSFSSPDPAATSFSTPSSIRTTSSIATTPSASGYSSSVATSSGGTSVVPVTSTETFTSTPSTTEVRTSSGFSTLSTASGRSSSSSSTAASSAASATRSNAAIAVTVPTVGFAWTLAALLASALF